MCLMDTLHLIDWVRKPTVSKGIGSQPAGAVAALGEKGKQGWEGSGAFVSACARVWLTHECKEGVTGVCGSWSMVGGSLAQRWHNLHAAAQLGTGEVVQAS
jgi:hypothetical protein